MSSFVPIVQELALPASVSIPVPLIFDKVFSIFHKAHRLWRWQRRIQELTGSSTGFKQIAAGYATQFALGDSRLLRIAAQSVLIARRIVEAAQRQQGFHSASCRLISALRARHVACLPALQPKALLNHPLSRVLSPSTFAWLLHGVHTVLYYLGDVIQSVVAVAATAFTLSMSLMDLTLAASLSQESQDEAFQELYINSSGLVDDLIENKAQLLKNLQDYRPVIEKLLTLCGASSSVEDLSAAVEESIDESAKVYGLVNRVVAATEEHAKNGLYALCLNLWGSAPSSFLPRKILQEKAKQSIPYSHFKT